MAKTVVRKNLRLFGGNGDTNSFAKYGSFVAGVPLKTKNIEDIQSLDAFVNGWQNAVVASNRAPFLEDMNALQYVMGYQLFYLLQEGISEWNTDTTYFQGSIVRRYTGGILQIYVSLTDDNLANALPTYPNNNINWAMILPASTTSLVGTITASQIASVNASVILGQIVASQIAAGSITAGKIAAAAVQAGNLAASVAGNGLVIGSGGAIDMNWDPNSGYTSGDLNYVKRFKLIQGNATTPQIISFPGGATTILSLNQGGVLIGLSAGTNNPGSGSASFQLRVTVDGNSYTLIGYTGIGPSGPKGYCSGGALNTGAPIIFNPTASYGNIGQLNIPFQSTLVIEVVSAGFTDGRWTSTVYYALGIVS